MTNGSTWRLLSWRLWFGSVLLWCTVCLLEQSNTYQGDEHGRMHWVGLQWRFVVQHLLWYLPAVPMTVLFAWTSSRLVGRPRFWLWFIGLVVAAASVSGGWMLLLEHVDGFSVTGWWLHYGPRYAALLGVLVLVEQIRQRDAARRELVAAQLRALRAQLQPHFLFNTLHTIGVTAKQDGTTAARMTTLLGDLLRQSVQEREHATVPLAQELELLQPYVQLQQLRFGDRLQVVVDVPEDVLAAEVPDLVLQPLVENALRHGIERLPGAGTIVVRARRSGPFLRLQVIDDGAGLDAAATEGTGLGATRARLAAIYGERAALELAPAGVRGTAVTLQVPFREVAHAA